MLARAQAEKVRAFRTLHERPGLFRMLFAKVREATPGKDLNEAKA